MIQNYGPKRRLQTITTETSSSKTVVEKNGGTTQRVCSDDDRAMWSTGRGNITAVELDGFVAFQKILLLDCTISTCSSTLNHGLASYDSEGLLNSETLPSSHHIVCSCRISCLCQSLRCRKDFLLRKTIPSVEELLRSYLLCW